MYTISKEFAFSASHQLFGLPNGHPCARLHGHNYAVQVELQAMELNAHGFVRDYRELTAFKNYLEEEIDHRHLNDLFGDDSVTAEKVGRAVFCLVQEPLAGGLGGAGERDAEDLGGSAVKSPSGIIICEIFGPTIQGEGSLIGLPTVFVRTGGCDYRCRWCDTAYAVDGDFRGDWKTMSATKILAEVRHLSGGQPLMITLSGGNPALQPMADLIELGRVSGYSFAMETQGSIVQPWFADLAVLTLSPKPPSSGMTTDWRKLEECLAAAGQAAVSLKLVVQDEDDYQYARQVAAQFPGLPVTLQPCNAIIPGTEDPAGNGDEAGLERLRMLVERVIEDGWYGARVLPQLHVLLWGNKRGR